MSKRRSPDPSRKPIFGSMPNTLDEDVRPVEAVDDDVALVRVDARRAAEFGAFGSGAWKVGEKRESLLQASVIAFRLVFTKAAAPVR